MLILIITKKTYYQLLHCDSSSPFRGVYCKHQAPSWNRVLEHIKSVALLIGIHVAITFSLVVWKLLECCCNGLVQVCGIISSIRGKFSRYGISELHCWSQLFLSRNMVCNFFLLSSCFLLFGYEFVFFCFQWHHCLIKKSSNYYFLLHGAKTPATLESTASLLHRHLRLHWICRVWNRKGSKILEWAFVLLQAL